MNVNDTCDIVSETLHDVIESVNKKIVDMAFNPAF